MKIILKTRMENLGEVGDIVKVANGYARNFLLPQNFAIPATSKNLNLISELKEADEKRRAEELKETEMIARQIEKVSIAFERNADEDGHLYGSVSESDIVSALDSEGLKIDKTNVKMEHHIKKIGEHTVDIILKNQIESKLKLNVVPTTKVEDE